MLNIMQTESLEVMKAIDVLENDFLSGHLDKLKRRPCPVCSQDSSLLYSVTTELKESDPEKKNKVSISIYCTGPCNNMISHMDGYCPSWAEGISDWDHFSKQINSN